MAGTIDLDPLRKFLPRADLFMPTPGGMMMVRIEAGEDATFEEKQERRNGGLVYGYCLRARSSYVTHIAVAQICNNQVGGKNGLNQLILGIIKIPFGRSKGYLLGLEGRNYAINYQDFGPWEQVLVRNDTMEGSALYKISPVSMGPVFPLEFEGMTPKAEQDVNTRTFQMVMRQPTDGSPPHPTFEVRHLCEQPIS